MQWMNEIMKIDPAFRYQVLAAAPGGVIGRYFRLSEYARMVFAFVVDTMLVAEACVATVVQATSAAGGGAANIATATCTITGNTNVNRVTVALATVLVGDTLRVTVNGGTAVVFTAAAVADLPNQVFSQAGADAADCTSLTAAINHAAAQALFAANGALVTAVDGGAGTLTLEITEPGTGVMTVVASAATMTVTTIEAVGFIEIDGTALTAPNDFVALRLAGPATLHATAFALRCMPRYAALTQRVGASDTDS